MSTKPYIELSTLSEEAERKLILSQSETEGLVLREIRCPYCNFLVERVFSDVTGHKMVYCKKCKYEYPINLGYFRRQKQYDGFHSQDSTDHLR